MRGRVLSVGVGGGALENVELWTTVLEKDVVYRTLWCAKPGFRRKAAERIVDAI